MLFYKKSKLMKIWTQGGAGIPSPGFATSYVCGVGFASCLAAIKRDYSLVTALIECWRQRNHMFPPTYWWGPSDLKGNSYPFLIQDWRIPSRRNNNARMVSTCHELLGVLLDGYEITSTLNHWLWLCHTTVRTCIYYVFVWDIIVCR